MRVIYLIQIIFGLLDTKGIRGAVHVQEEEEKLGQAY